MSEATRLRRLQAFLNVVAILLFAGTIVELVAVKHYQELMQLVPFALCIAGIGAIGWVWRRPAPRAALAARVLMLVIAAGSLLGVYEHLEGNYSFAHDIHPRASTT